MFNIEKILLFVVTMISSMAFLFYMLHPALPTWCHGLITVHRIKTGLTLLSPVIFGAITAYIAYQQHVLTLTQANIARDQRDIAYGKQKLENFDKLYEYLDDFHSLYNETFHFPSEYPKRHMTNNTHKIFDIYPDIENNDFSDYEKKWVHYYMEKGNYLEKILSKCEIDVEKLTYMFDENIIRKINHFIAEAESLIFHKKDIIYQRLYSESNSKWILEKIEYEKLVKKSFVESYREMKKEIKPYISVSDILAPRKLGEYSFSHR